jgi:glycosyltransferase involved in cell wall biosynthesis
VRQELTGVERWASEMVARLPALRPEAYAVVAPPPALAYRAGQAWEQLVLPLRAARRRASLIYSPANLAPLGWPRNVVLVHDIGPMRNPAWYSPAYARWHRLLLPWLVRRAVKLITVSEFSRGEMVELLGVESRRVAIVPGGVDERFRPEADAEPARAALGLRSPYVLAIGNLTPRKNLTALELSARRLREEGHELVIGGGGRSHLRVGNEGLGGMRLLGPVPDEHLPGLYAGATVFVLPSKYEGFGLPCLEAMAVGVPVVATTASALPETCGDAGILVDPDDHAGLADALLGLVADSERRASLSARGLERAAGFSWDRAARSTDKVLREL